MNKVICVWLYQVIPGYQKQPIQNAAQTTQTVLKATESHQNDKQAATMNPHVQTLGLFIGYNTGRVER